MSRIKTNGNNDTVDGRINGRLLLKKKELDPFPKPHVRRGLSTPWYNSYETKRFMVQRFYVPAPFVIPHTLPILL